MEIRKKIAMLLLFVLVPFIVKSQISTDEKPISFYFEENMFKTNKENLKIMSPIDLEKLRIEDEEDEIRGIPPRFGFPHTDKF